MTRIWIPYLTKKQVRHLMKWHRVKICILTMWRADHNQISRTITCLITHKQLEVTVVATSPSKSKRYYQRKNLTITLTIRISRWWKQMVITIQTLMLHSFHLLLMHIHQSAMEDIIANMHRVTNIWINIQVAWTTIKTFIFSKEWCHLRHRQWASICMHTTKCKISMRIRTS
jgi:hypothetical protein